MGIYDNSCVEFIGILEDYKNNNSNIILAVDDTVILIKVKN